MAASGSTADTPLLEPLSFPTSPKSAPQKANTHLQCLFCTELYSIMDAGSLDVILKHLLMEHKFVIHDAKLVASFEKYMEYWRLRFHNRRLEEFCTVIKTNSKTSDIAPSEDFYLLCDALPEDKEIRQKLQKEKLEEVVQQLEFEKKDRTFNKGCLFCRRLNTQSRDEYFNHLMSQHNFNLGHPHNIVYKDELITMLEDKLEKLQCLYCEKFFKDRHVLKEHMRKKNHKRIDPHNNDYDRFYVVNYREAGQNWESLDTEQDEEEEEEEEEDTDATHSDDDGAGCYGEWKEEEGEAQNATCLFCEHQAKQSQQVFTHMTEEHSFDFERLKREQKLTFYQQVKLVNYIRRQVVQQRCVVCRLQCGGGGGGDSLLTHMTPAHLALLHTHTPTAEWDQPQYFFPTYEDDPLLCYLGEDGEEEDGAGAGAENPVLPEDFHCPHDSVLRNVYTLMGLELDDKRLLAEDAGNHSDNDNASDNEEAASAHDPDEWKDWQEEEADRQCGTCLFCTYPAHTAHDIFLHMKNEHSFDFEKFCEQHNLTFYQQVKLVNYIRTQVVQQRCVVCRLQCGGGGGDSLLTHMTPAHLALLHTHPPTAEWDQPQYFSPVCEDDLLLCHLGAAADDAAAGAGEESVTAEDMLEPHRSILSQPHIQQQLQAHNTAS